MKTLVKITKEILKKSMMCGTFESTEDVVQNCAIALAVREIIPKAKVFSTMIDPGLEFRSISLPIEAQKFIEAFDNLASEPKVRLELPELSFEIDIPNELIQKIGINQVYKILSESKSLELVML